MNFLILVRYDHAGRSRLAIATILLGDQAAGWLCHFGLKCSSFTPVNAGTSGRSPCCAIGNIHYKSVLEGNCLASRKLGVVLSHQKSLKENLLEVYLNLNHFEDSLSQVEI